MTFAHVHSREWGYGSERAKRELERLRDVGVDWIAISPFAYQKKVDEPFLYYGPGDPTMLDRDLVAVTEHAHALGIRVFLKPHLWSGEFWSSGKWPGDIEMKTPEAEESWWRSYTGYIVAQAKLAALAKMDALSIGHELVKMTAPRHTPRWRALITEVKRHFGGPLVYGANHGHEVGQIEFWDALDAVGVHAYYPLGGDALEAASADDIARAWQPVLAELRKIADKTKKPLVFTEVGFPAHRGALAKPWEADGARPLDEGLQARAYEGTLRALASAPFVRGTFWWKWFSGGHENPHEREPYDPSGKAAERVLKRWYRGG
ncbi:hypothetical protein L6R52_13545 [Myxococcota bacterium]|nr:hypothetical protein [Myxococcota bacterium]